MPRFTSQGRWAPTAPQKTAAMVAVAFLAAVATVVLLRLPLHAPDLALLMRVGARSPLIPVHLAAALTALAIGIVLLVGVKGTAAHRALGYGWVAAMGVTAVSSLFIRVINPGRWSYIHFLSGWVIIALPLGVAFARRREVRRHARMMTGLFVGGLLIAGAFTLVPGRLMWRVFFG